MTAQGGTTRTAEAWPIERPTPRLTRWREPSILPGFPLALGVLGLGWALLTHDPGLLDAIRAHAPLFARIAELARAALG